MRSIFLVVAMVMSIAMPTAADAAADAAACGKLNGEIIGNVCVPTKAGTGLSDAAVGTIIAKVATWLLFVFGALAVVTFLICGFQYLLTISDDAQAENAKRCIKWAIVGVVLTGLTFVIMRIISSLITGAAP